MAEDITVTGAPLVVPYTEGEIEIFYEFPERYIVLPKGRRFGATSSAAGYCIENLIEGKSILWVDTVQVNCDKYFYKYFMPILKNIKTDFWGYRQSKDLRILNGLLDFRSAEKPQNIEGFGYHIIIINEAGIVLKGQKGRDLWNNTIRAMALDYKAKVFFLGTPKGKKAKKDEAPAKFSLYYELACKGGYEDPDHNLLIRNHSPKTVEKIAEDEEAIQDRLDRITDDADEAVEESIRLHKKEDNWRTIQVTSYDNPLLDPIEIEEMESDVPRVTRAQEIRGRFIDAGDEEVFHEDWFPIVYELPPSHLWRRKIISLDTAFKKGAENDDSAGVVFLEAAIENVLNYYWLDTFVEKLEFPELVKKAKEFFLKHNTSFPVNRILIEDKASGTPLIQTFTQQVNSLFRPTPIVPITDKYNRAVAVSPFFEQGKVHLLAGSWNQPAIDQLCDFNAKLDTPDDIVDAVSQFFNYIKSSPAPKAKAVTRKRKHKVEILRGYE